MFWIATKPQTLQIGLAQAQLVRAWSGPRRSRDHHVGTRHADAATAAPAMVAASAARGPALAHCARCASRSTALRDRRARRARVAPGSAAVDAVVLVLHCRM